MLKAAVDVYYKGESAKAVCILFEQWSSTSIIGTHMASINHVAAYEPGAFFKRELPCILSVLKQTDLSLLDALVVDGYVYLDEKGRKGLGAYVYEALQKKIAVVGVAKTKFSQAGAVAVYRGKSQTPLYVTAAGMDVNKAGAAVHSMAGDYRLPFLLKVLDRKTREGDTA